MELINEYRKLQDKNLAQKSLEFIHTNNEKSEREIKETIPFTIAMKRIKYLGIYLPKETTRKLLELINEYSEVARYKINTQKSLAFLYTNNEKSEREIKETIPLTTATTKKRYLEELDYKES